MINISCVLITAPVSDSFNTNAFIFNVPSFVLCLT